MGLLLPLFKIMDDPEFKAMIRRNFIEITNGVMCHKTRGRGKEPKPFKSGGKYNTIKSVTTNPNTGNDAFEFYEDESCVDVDRVMIHFECADCGSTCFAKWGHPFFRCETCDDDTVHKVHRPEEALYMVQYYVTYSKKWISDGVGRIRFSGPPPWRSEWLDRVNASHIFKHRMIRVIS